MAASLSSEKSTLQQGQQMVAMEAVEGMSISKLYAAKPLYTSLRDGIYLKLDAARMAKGRLVEENEEKI
jgi:hypothetical protein